MGVKTGKSGTKSIDSGSREPSNIPAAPTGAVEFKCHCGRGYASKATLSRHQKDCGRRDQSKCQFCDRPFPTFAGVRQHERRAHPAEYQQQLQDELPAPESEIMEKLARIEVQSLTGVFYARMVNETGLTKQQVRYRREKPEYKEYLEKARRQLARKSTNTYSPAATSCNSKRTLRSKTRPQSPSSLATMKVALPAALAKAPQCRPGSRTGNVVTRLRSGITSQSRTSVKSQIQTDSSSDSTLSAEVTDESSIWDPSSAGSESTTVGSISANLSLSEDDSVPIMPDQSSILNETKSRSLTDDGKGKAPLLTIIENNIVVHPNPAISPAEIPTAETTSQPHPQRLRRRSRSLPPYERPASGNGSPLGDLAAYLHGIVDLAPHDDKEELETLVESGLEMPDGELKLFIDRWLAEKFKRPQRRQRGGRNRRKGLAPHYGQEHTGNNNRAANFKKCQDLYGKAKRGLAEAIIKGRNMDSPSEHPTVENVERLYGGLLGSESPEDREIFRPKHRAAGAFSLPFIAVSDVQQAKSGWSHSACGTDGVRVDMVKSAPNHTLAVLFNILLHRNIHPTTWSILRTTLVPKCGDLKDPANWRPITIGSAIERLFHRVLAARIQSLVGLSLHQRGFVSVDGTLGNSLILHEYVKHRLSCRKPYNVVSLDVKKAFDTVSHHSIRRALNRIGVPFVLTEYVMGTFNATTTIKVGNDCTGPIGIRRGVRQGDPLSPIIFNIVMDELLDRVSNKYDGATLPNGERCSIMAFADDLLLLTDKEVDLPLMLEDTTTFLQRRGMQLNAAKCRLLAGGVVSGRSIACSRVRLTLDGVRIPNVGTLDTFRYLGHDFGYSGIEKPSIHNLSTWLQNVHKAPLKPDQKVSLIRQYLIPRLLYGLQNPRVDKRTLREADRLIKRSIKRTLHLNVHTPDALLYASVRDGGLGLMELSRSVPRILLGRLTRLLEKQDQVLGAVLQSDSVRGLMSRLSDMAGDIPEATYWRERIATSVLSRGLQQAAEDSASRLWVLDKPAGWSGRDYVRAVQLRTANLPTKAIPSNPVGERRCRGGCACDENISHVLQTCPVTHWERIHRHNEIVTKVARHCRKRGWTVEEEPHIRSKCGQLFKPDLAVHQPDGTLVVADVQVAWDSDDLSVPYERKRRKYDVAPFREAARRRWPGKTLTFAPIIVGARGIWPRVNNDRSAVLQIPSILRRSCVHSALKWASTIHGAFMKAVWRKSGGPQSE